MQADAASKGERARARLDGAADKHAATLARESAAIDANTRAAMDAAKAYITSGAPSGEEAEARRKAVTDATKKGTNVDAAVRQQIAASGADADLAGAKAISTLLQESAARRQVNADVESGVTSVDDMARALGDEEKLRALTTAQTLAQKNGLTDLYRDITAEIDKYRQALTEANDEAARSGSLKAFDDIGNRLQDAQLTKRFAGDTTGGYDRAKAALDANRAADADHETDPGRREARVTGSVDATVAGQNAQHAQFAKDAVRSSNDNLAVTQAQIAAVGKSGDAQQLVIDKLKLQQSLAIALKGDYAEFAPEILAAATAADQSAAHLKQVQAAMGAIRQAGDKFIDDLFNPQGNGLKKALADVREELERMALINPLKNFLLGENNPTIMSLAGGGSGGGNILSRLFGGGGGSILSKLFGGGNSNPFARIDDQANTSIASIIAANPIHFAAGTDYAPGGVAEVGENGPERIYLPQGSKVTNAGDTRRMMSAANDPAHIRVSVETNDPAFTAKISSISGAHVEAAAPGIRSAAVSDVKAHYARQSRYAYGRG